MKVINLDSWAGPDFEYRPGQVIDLPEAVAQARIIAGLCAPVEAVKPTKSKLFTEKD